MDDRTLSIEAAPDREMESRLMLKVIAEDFIHPEAVEIVLPLYRELVEKTRQEDLCISYDLFIDQKDPGHFTRLVSLINAHQRQKATFILMDAFPA